MRDKAVEAALRKQLERIKCVGPHSYSCSACSWLYCCCRLPSNANNTLQVVTNPADDCPRTRGPCTTPSCGGHSPWATTWAVDSVARVVNSYLVCRYAGVRMLVWCLNVAKTLVMVILLHAVWFLSSRVSLSKFLPHMLLLTAYLGQTLSTLEALLFPWIKILSCTHLTKQVILRPKAAHNNPTCSQCIIATCLSMFMGKTTSAIERSSMKETFMKTLYDPLL